MLQKQVGKIIEDRRKMAAGAQAINWGFAAEKFVGFGLPGFLGPITGIAEVVASGFLIVGFR